MEESAPVSTFVATAKQHGATDETVLMMLHDKGWSDRTARRELAAYYEGLIGVAAPVRHDAGTSNPLDGFLYVFATGTLVAWVTAAILLGNSFIDAAFSAAASRPGYESGWQVKQAVSNLATLLVTCPVYLGLMVVLHRRLKVGATAWNSPVRLWILSATLLIGVATILGYVVSALASFLGGAPSTASLLKSGYALVILVGLSAYYLRWLRMRAKIEETM